jgi:serine/threonine protein kinase
MIDRNDPTTAALLRGVADQYDIEREIGRGGMGVVYLATDVQLERPVAIKTLPQHLAADPRVRHRFLREARTAGALSHPNIVPIYAAAERDGVVYFAMRYINGESLADRIQRSGSLAPGEVVWLLRQLASALGYAHANGVVHRDIKAENVLLDSETGRAMLTDFGIARLTEVQPLTATGTVLGTVQYMSPEQVSGETLDGRSDLYSLGILAFYALCGRFPFERPTASAIVVAHVTSAPPKICSLANGVPAPLGDVVDRLLAKSPADRYDDGNALRKALDALPIDAAAPASRGDDSAPMSLLAPSSVGARLSAFERSPQATPAEVDAQHDAASVLSSDEAQQVWARAAELQANTGMIVPPAEFRVRPGNTPLETVGFNADIVRASAVDAGIDARYVDRAIAERNAVARATNDSAEGHLPVAIATGALGTKKVNPFIGAPVKLELESSFDGELSDLGFEEIADEIRRSLGEMVTVSAVGRSLTVTTASGPGGRNGMPRRLQIHLSSRNGRTTVRAFEDMTQLATGMMFGITMGGGFGLGSMSMGMIMGSTHNGALAFATLATTLTVAFTLARTLFGRSSRKRDREVRDILARVVRRGKELVADDAKRLSGRR